jgi:hypothetical protein
MRMTLLINLRVRTMCCSHCVSFQQTSLDSILHHWHSLQIFKIHLNFQVPLFKEREDRNKLTEKKITKI